nr:hypothetical protein [Sinorhizobium fredii]
MGDATRVVFLAGLETPWCQSEVGTDSARTFKAGRVIDCRLEAQRRYVSNAWNTHKVCSYDVLMGRLADTSVELKEGFEEHLPGLSHWQERIT